MLVDPDFRRLLAGYDLQALDASDNLVLGVRTDRTIGLRNRAWNEGARRDGASSLADPDARLHALEPIAGPLRDFYAGLYDAADASSEPVEHEYLCHTPELYRRFRMRMMPLQGAVLVTHQVMVMRPHDRPEAPPDPALYREGSGLTRMCAHCRATKRVGTAAWDWVPEYVEKLPARASHGLCPSCVAWYYPEPGDPQA